MNRGDREGDECRVGDRGEGGERESGKGKGKGKEGVSGRYVGLCVEERRSTTLYLRE
jgi:hypothetical protein